MTGSFTGDLEKIDDYRWMVPKNYREGMRVPGIIFSSEEMLKDILKDNAPEQVVNAAYLPGIVKASMAMPDIHWGYGLPIGGVVATDVDAGGVISPGGVGFDINCGVRLIRTDLSEKEVRPRVRQLADDLFRGIPAGVGSTGDIDAGNKEQKKIFIKGSGWAVDKGYGWQEDLLYCEEQGAVKGADPEAVSSRAYARGKKQPGTLGSGNHFVEVQVVDEIYDAEAAEVFGIKKGQVTVMIHTGSRGVGHQICGDYAEKMIKCLGKYKISMPDRQLACVPVESPEGREYLGAMRSAANYAWNNRQIITHLTRQVFEKVFGERAVSLGMRLVYDVAHNIAKIEEHEIGGRVKRLCVHRKGATRAFPPGHKDLPAKYMKTGQPVIIPGDMGRCSYLLSGTARAEETFYSTCHGAGRLMSRKAAIRGTKGRNIQSELAQRDILVRHTGRQTLNEEVSEAYKDVSRVVDIVHNAGISKKISRMKPICVVKG